VLWTFTIIKNLQDIGKIKNLCNPERIRTTEVIFLPVFKQTPWDLLNGAFDSGQEKLIYWFSV